MIGFMMTGAPSTPTAHSTPTASPARRSRWLVPALLIAISIVPVAAGAVLIAQLAGGAQITPANARFFASPVPVMIHIPAASLLLVLGPFQFIPGLRRRRPGLHRAAGWLLVPCGIATGLAGLWMAVYYPLAPGDVEVLRFIRLVFGSALVASFAVGLVAIRRRDIAGHRAWMIRGYAIGQGAGTQFVTGMCWLVATGGRPEEGMPKAVLLAASWVFNILLAEWLIRRKLLRNLSATPSTGSSGVDGAADRTQRCR
jgi:uncharacterized membrane protein